MEQTSVDARPAVTPPAPAPTRRRVLALAAVTGAGGAVLAACGGGDDSATPGAGGSGGQSSAPDGSSSPPGGAGTALTDTAEVPVGGGVILKQEKIVVTQPTEGTFKAFSAVCTHKSCLVGKVEDGVISCPCHGSAYSAVDGSVQNGPATRALTEVAVTVEGGKVVES